MALSSSPRKIVPLATGDEPRPKSISSYGTVTKRVFYCGVVIEGSENGRRLPEEIQDLVLSLGNPLPSNSSSDLLSSSSALLNEKDNLAQRKRALTDTSALSAVVNELVTSERSYVRRLQILKSDYADPLRNFARSKDTAIIPAYEAKTLFGNIDALVPVNEDFLKDLELMLLPNGSRTVGGVGDIALKHFKDQRGFENYKQYYTKREEAQAIFEREISKRSSRFGAYIDHIKYQSADPKNRVGLRELLMEPVQRVPRYTLLFRTMVKHMAPDDPQRSKVLEATEIASKIALAEADEHTRRAAIFYCLIASIDGFPPELFSNSRRFIDCIDVEDTISDPPLSSGASSTNMAATSLHCTLFLFDDKLVIVKRPGNGEKSGRVLSGLEELDKVTKAGGIPSGKKKSGMTCKGVVDVTEVVATDIGGAEINLFLENPPQDQSERWSGRPFRSLSVVNPPSPINMDPIQTELHKQRFLENLWNVQATYRARAGQSVVLRAEEQEVDSRAGRITVARTYFNVYQRSAFLQEAKKTKIVVHIDPLGSADPIPFGIGSPPFVRIRIQPMAGGLCRYAVTSSDPADEGEEDIVQTERVPSRVVQTIHQFGLFEFKTGRNSLPTTPTARSKAAIFGLDAISRNLFSSRPGSSMGDFFGGSISGRRRSKSVTSRSSTYTHTTTTRDGSLTKFSERSNSTAATTVSVDEGSSLSDSRSSRGKKFTQRARSNTSMSDSEVAFPGLYSSSSRPQSPSRSLSSYRGSDCSDAEDDNTILEISIDADPSDYDLRQQLELARKNSMSQPELVERVPISHNEPIEDVIYEDEPPQPLRPVSRASADASSHLSTTPRPSSPRKLPDSPTRSSRPLSSHPTESRPFGPRSPSPLPSRSQVWQSILSIDEDDVQGSPPGTPHRQPATSRAPEAPLLMDSTPIRRSIFPTGHTEITPREKIPENSTSPTPHSIEPLSIKKKTSVRTSSNLLISSSPFRKTFPRNSPLSRVNPRIISPRRVSPQIRKLKAAQTSSVPVERGVEQLVQLSVATLEDIESAQRTVKRIKLEVNGLRNTITKSHDEESLTLSRSASPEKGIRSPQPTPTMTKAAQERLEEMRQLIGKRQADVTPRRKGFSPLPDTPSRSFAPSNYEDIARNLDNYLANLEKELSDASSCQKILTNDLKQLAMDNKEGAVELEKTRMELQHSKRQCELVKSLLADATAEKEIMYEAFNEELDGMYNDINLPDDEAWFAMSKDLRKTKEDRNALARDNSQLKRKLAESELQREEWGILLRAHGLIP